MNSEALEYVKDRYNEEVSRFAHIEAKSGQLLSLLSILIAAFGAVVGFRSETLFESHTQLDCFILLVLLATIMSLAAAWGFALAALKLGQCPVPNKSRKNSEYLLSASNEDVFAHIVDCYVDTTELLSPIIEKKANRLEFSYRSLVLSAILAGMFSVLLTLKELFV